MFKFGAGGATRARNSINHRHLTHLSLIAVGVLCWSISSWGKETGGEKAAIRGKAKSTIVLIDAGIRHDLGTFVQKETVGRASVVDESRDVYALGPMLRLGLLFPLLDNLRVGAVFGYGFNYTLIERRERRDQGDPEKEQLGQLITADLRAEWSPHLAGAFNLILSPVATITMISPGGELKARSLALEDSHNVWKGPRLGWAAGVEAGARYMFKPWMSFRLTAGYSYNNQGLLRATRRGDAADSKRIWRSSASRLTGLFGVEAHF